jgi:tetratricopeptide (TPR) repeat protein
MHPLKNTKSSSQHRRIHPSADFVLVRGLACWVALLLLATSSAVLSSRVGAQTQNQDVPGLPELKKGDYEQAVKLLTARLTANPNDAEAESYLLRAYVETGRYTEAETAGKKFLLKNADAGLVQHQLAEVYVQTGRYAEAVAELERAAANLEKANAAIDKKLYSDLRRAEVLRLMGQEDRAQAIFASVVKYFSEHDPDNAAELSLLARTLVHLERFQDANDVFRNAIEADPTLLETQLEAGELFSEKYNYAEAAQFYVDALQVNPNSARAHLDLAINKMLEGSEEMLPAIGRALAFTICLASSDPYSMTCRRRASRATSISTGSPSNDIKTAVGKRAKASLASSRTNKSSDRASSQISLGAKRVVSASAMASIRL